MARLTPRFVPLSTAMMACVGSTVEFHPEMEPSSLTKMNRAGSEVPFFVTWKNCVSLKTCPVGFPVPRFRALVGIVTISEAAVPSWWYRVETPVPLSLTQIVPLGETDTPHGLTRFGSTCCATPGISDWKFVHEYVSPKTFGAARIASANKDTAMFK